MGHGRLLLIKEGGVYYLFCLPCYKRPMVIRYLLMLVLGVFCTFGHGDMTGNMTFPENISSSVVHVDNTNSSSTRLRRSVPG